MIPALDFSGKIIMESKNEISFSPNGNGGLFDYLEKDESIFTQM
jgi:UDP-N-acetylglucosamine/UDP-N-acetylgalactosamine diphosphorylase